MLTALFIILGLLIFWQMLLSAPVLKCFIRFFWGEYADVSFRGPGFILPLFFFIAWDVRIMARGGPKRDRIYFEAKRLRFGIDPIFLLFKRLRIVNFCLHSPVLDYTNRQNSFEKNRYLPSRHRIEIKNGRISDGRVYVQDETMSPVYKMQMYDIRVTNADMDVATSADIFFRTQRGNARIGDGKIEIGRTSETGYIRINGVKWSELLGMGKSQVIRGEIALKATHRGGASSRYVSGIVGNRNLIGSSGSDDKKIEDLAIKIPFEFELDWNDLRLTFDLGLQKLISLILSGATNTGISRTVLPGLRGLFELVKKQEE